MAIHDFNFFFYYVMFLWYVWKSIKNVIDYKGDFVIEYDKILLS